MKLSKFSPGVNKVAYIELILHFGPKMSVVNAK